MKGFTLIELLIVIAIIAVLSVVVILSLNPVEYLRQSRDSGRLSDMDTINKALGLTQVDGLPLGSSNVVYVSIPDPTTTSTAGNQCQGLGLPTLPATYTYHCAASSTYRQINGTGWVPVNFTNLAQGTPMGQLPQDPVSNTSSRLYYTYTTNGYQYETTAVMESLQYKLGGGRDVTGPDGGPLASVYEKGTKLGLEPLDYGDASLVGYWTFDEGTGSIAYDWSGNGKTGNWGGTLGGQWTTGRIGHAGNFNGTNNQVPTGVSIGATFTLSAWINSTLTGGDSYYTILGGNGIFMTGNNLNYYYVANHNSATSLSSSTWYLIDVVSNGGNVSYYVNANLDANTFTGATGFGSAIIGGHGNEYFPGFIDDVRIYNRALSASEITALYAGGK